jgi:hypothetical protein
MSILSLVASILVPKFADLASTARDTLATAMTAELNRTYAAWVDSGGIAGKHAMTSDILTAMTSSSLVTLTPSLLPSHFPAVSLVDANGCPMVGPDGNAIVVDDSQRQVVDTANSAGIRVSMPVGLTLPALSEPGQSAVTFAGGTILFNPVDGRFVVIASSARSDASAIQSSFMSSAGNLVVGSGLPNCSPPPPF